MKKILLTITIMWSTITLGFSQATQSFSYQAVIRDSEGDLVTSTAISLQLSILEETSSGSVVYSETQSVTTDMYGNIVLSVGEGTIESGSWDAIDWMKEAFLMVEVDLTGGTNFINMGTTQIMTVPRAISSMHATKADSAKTAESAKMANMSDSAAVSGHAAMADTAMYAYNTNDNDSDPMNEIQSLYVSPSGDSLCIGSGNCIVIPGISDANYKDTTIAHETGIASRRFGYDGQNKGCGQSMSFPFNFTPTDFAPGLTIDDGIELTLVVWDENGNEMATAVITSDASDGAFKHFDLSSAGFTMQKDVTYIFAYYMSQGKDINVFGSALGDADEGFIYGTSWSGSKNDNNLNAFSLWGDRTWDMRFKLSGKITP